MSDHLSHPSHPPHGFNLHERARQAMRDEGFAPDFSPDIQRELSLWAEALRTESALVGDVRDLRTRLWSSIDNVESRDLDQVEVAEAGERGTIRLLVGIADVEAFAPPRSALDLHASENATSVYTGVEMFPMLPEQLSTDWSSLLNDADRLAIVVEMVVDAQGEIESSDIYRAQVRNHAKLAYETVGDWLESGGDAPPEVARVAGLEAQLRLQNQAAIRLRAQRMRAGALDFETVEARPVMENGQVRSLDVPRKNQARYLIENLMIAANMVMATYLEATGRPSIQRVVREPQRWPRIVAIAAEFGASLPDQPDPRALSDFLAARKVADPAHFPDLSLTIVKLLGPGEYAVVHRLGEPIGHFGLAAHNYTHSTAPNRRYADLVTQRLLKAILHHAPAPYDEASLEAIARRCTERENAARKVERLMRKVIAADLLHNRIGETFQAVVTGVASKGVFVRLTAPPVEGRVVAGEAGLDVGDRLRVRLVGTDRQRGFIDFARADAPD